MIADNKISETVKGSKWERQGHEKQGPGNQTKTRAQALYVEQWAPKLE